MRVPSQWMISSRVTVAWNIVGYLVYAALAFVGGFAVWFSLFFAMATDGCHDSACDASYHVFPGHGHHVDRSWRGLAAHLGGHGSQLVARQRRDRMAFCWVVGAWPCLRGCRCGLALIDVGFCVSRRRGFGRRGIRTGTGSARRGRWPVACSAVAARCARRPGDGNRCCRSSRVGRGCRH